MRVFNKIKDTQDLINKMKETMENLEFIAIDFPDLDTEQNDIVLDALQVKINLSLKVVDNLVHNELSQDLYLMMCKTSSV